MVCFYVISSGPVTQVSVKAGLIFFTAIRWQIWLILDPSPLQNADVLNGWSHRWLRPPEYFSQDFEFSMEPP